VRGSCVEWERTLGGKRPQELERAVRGARVARVGRRGKFIILDLERRGREAGCVVVHLRMTGRLSVEPERSEPGPWMRVALRLDKGEELRFVDVRKFGRLVPASRPADVHGELGPEPLEARFSADWLYEALRGRRRMLKPLLLDQRFLAGLGNIYVDEALHAARLHPLRRSDGISRAKATLLHAVIRQTLAEAIEREGSSFDSFYRTPEGRPGSYQHQFQVYGRTGRPCRSCGRAVVRIVVSQRGTHLCTRCQPRPRARRVRILPPS